jgi:hypothetical protein
MMDLQEMVCGDMECSDVDQNRDRRRALVDEVMNNHVPQNAGYFGLA